MKKTKYSEAELEVIIFEQSDIVTASVTVDPEDTDWGGGQGGGW